jgi:hypothetical protein
MKFIIPILLVLIVFVTCDWTSPERSAFENDPIIKELNAPKPEADTNYIPSDIDRDFDPWHDQIQQFRNIILPNAPWNKEEYWVNGNALYKFINMLENYPNFFQMDFEDQRRELEKYWKFPDTGFNLEKFIEENRWFFPEKLREWNELHKNDFVYQPPPQPQPEPQPLLTQAPAPVQNEEPKQEKSEEPKEEHKEESKEDSKREKKEDREEDLSWLDLAKEKWGNWTDSLKDKYEDKKEELKKKFSFYNQSYYDQYHKELPENLWDKYRAENATVWEKTKDFFADAGEKISNFTHIGEATDKIKNWAKSTLGIGDNDTKHNETEEKGDDKRSEDYKDKDLEKEDRKDRDYEKKGKDYDRKDRDYERRDRDFDREDKKKDIDEYQSRENLDKDDNRESFRRDTKDFKKEEAKEDKNLKFLDKKEGE